jgi:acetolactate synthase-1/2/3 large subunit
VAEPTRDASPIAVPRDGHAGELAIAAARAAGVDTVFTLSGAHVFPLYDAAVRADPPLRLLDVRHEATAVFAAEAVGKLTRTPGFAALTAGPGVTNGVSAIAQASFAGSPLVVFGGRAPAARWGSGSLQELDHPPIVATVAKLAETVGDPAAVGDRVAAAFDAARTPHRGPAFVDVPMDVLFAPAEATPPAARPPEPVAPDPDDIDRIAATLARSTQPILVLGTDVWAGAAEDAALRLVDELGLPVVTNGMARGIVPSGHPRLATKARSTALGECDVALVVGAPLDFRLGFGALGGRGGVAAAVMHVADADSQLSTHVPLAASSAGDLRLALDALADRVGAHQPADWTRWRDRLAADSAAAAHAEQAMLQADSRPIHPARIYGELIPRLAPDAVVIGDGGDFVSFAGKLVEPVRPGCWLDPGPYGCLGAGLGAAIAARLCRPTSQVVLLLGDGAAGMSLMDIDTLVRHRLPVAIVVGNNSAWGLEKHPMRALYGYDVVADLAPATRYDEVAKALGADGETVERPGDIGSALDRAFGASGPYLVNVITDPEVAYPRQTTGV